MLKGADSRNSGPAIPITADLEELEMEQIFRGHFGQLIGGAEGVTNPQEAARTIEGFASNVRNLQDDVESTLKALSLADREPTDEMIRFADRRDDVLALHKQRPYRLTIQTPSPEKQAAAYQAFVASLPHLSDTLPEAAFGFQVSGKRALIFIDLDGASNFPIEPVFVH